MITARQRWQSFFLRLNHIEAQDDDPERAVTSRIVYASIGPQIPRQIVLHPRDEHDHELGPPCACCARELNRQQLLIACTVCLQIGHYECWRRSGGCPTVACIAERALPFRQRMTG